MTDSMLKIDDGQDVITYESKMQKDTTVMMVLLVMGFSAPMFDVNPVPQTLAHLVSIRKHLEHFVMFVVRYVRTSLGGFADVDCRQSRPLRPEQVALSL